MRLNAMNKLHSSGDIGEVLHHKDAVIYIVKKDIVSIFRLTHTKMNVNALTGDVIVDVHELIYNC
jgi:hypothetical protein